MVVAEAMKPHVAVLPSPAMGHIIALFELAKRLIIHHGFRVSILVITTEASAAQNQLLRSPTLPSDLNVVDLPPVDVSDLAFEIFRELSIPTYSFFTTSTALFAFSLYLLTLDREVEGEFVDLPEPVQVPGCKAIRTEDLLDQVRNRKIDEYKWHLLHVSRLPMAAGISANTWDDFEPVSLRALRRNPFFQNIPTPPVHTIGPLIKEDEPVTESDTEILTWLDKQPSDSVLLVALCSGGTLSCEQFTELAWGLEMSQQRFILAARTPTDASASAAFFNVGSDVNDQVAYLPEGFVKRTEGVGLVVPSWAPQVAAMSEMATTSNVTDLVETTLKEKEDTRIIGRRGRSKSKDVAASMEARLKRMERAVADISMQLEDEILSSATLEAAVEDLRGEALGALNSIG
ncbi:hypothetical protein F0562_019663 [Nyssa sinensis]|uniref:Uncharacterized protein n=1 Tax=Nyssa sinensis TaxID=561372 RepID=A0A5J5BT73_9ASTE|nr:hypothetical protein F0562_019663 [Nyssa sinensis]